MKRNLLPICLTVLAIGAFSLSLATDDLYLGAAGKALSIGLLLKVLRNGNALHMGPTLR